MFKIHPNLIRFWLILFEQLHIFFHLHRISPAFVACSWQTGQQGVLSPSFPTCPPPPVTRPFPPGRSCPLHLTSTKRLLPTPRQMFRMNQIFYSTIMTSSHQVKSCENFAKNAFLTLWMFFFCFYFTSFSKNVTLFTNYIRLNDFS